MKKLQILCLTLISVITFSACATTDTTTQTDQSDIAQMGDDQSVGDDFLDQKAFEDALDTQNQNRCDDIEDEAEKFECKKMVESLHQMDLAIAAQDKEMCQNVEDERIRETCIETIDFDLELQKQAEENFAQIQEETAANRSIEQEAMEKNDASICDRIEDEIVKYSCRFNIISNKAIQANDPNLCDEIGDPGFIENCKVGLGGVDQP